MSRKAVRCLFELDKVAVIDQPCIYEASSDGNFTLGADEMGIKSFVQVTRSQDGLMQASWNKDPSSSNAGDSLGLVVRRGACWTNGRALICAWKFDPKVDSTIAFRANQQEKERLSREPKSLFDDLGRMLGVDP